MSSEYNVSRNTFIYITADSARFSFLFLSLYFPTTNLVHVRPQLYKWCLEVIVLLVLPLFEVGSLRMDLSTHSR